MITVSTDRLSVKDEARLRKWLTDDAAFLFLSSLKSEQAVEEVAALAAVQKQADDVLRGAPISTTAMSHLRKASIISSAIVLIERKMKDDSELITAKPVIE